MYTTKTVYERFQTPLVNRGWLATLSMVGLLASLAACPAAPTKPVVAGARARRAAPPRVTPVTIPASCRERPKGSMRALDAYYNEQAFAVMRRVMKPDSVGVDVGAYWGLFVGKMSRQSPKATHHAFEPVPKLAAALRKRLAKVSNIKIHELAVSDRAGKATFTVVVEHPGYSGLNPRRHPDPKVQKAKIEVRVDTLDHVLPATSKPTYIKIDVEGAELQVMRGAKATITRAKPVIVFEFDSKKPAEMFDFLAGVGLKISLMRCWLTAKAPLTRAEFIKNQHSHFYFLAHP